MTTTEIPEHLLRRREAIERADRIARKLMALKEELEAEILEEEVRYMDINASEENGLFRVEISIVDSGFAPLVVEWNEGEMPTLSLTDDQFWFLLGLFPTFSGPDYVIEILLHREAAVRGFNYLQDARDSVEGVASRKMVEEAAEPVDQLDEEEDIEDELLFDFDEEPILIINDIVAVKGIWTTRTDWESELPNEQTVAHFAIPFKMKIIEDLAVSAAMTDGEDMLRDVPVHEALKQAGLRRGDSVDVIIPS